MTPSPSKERLLELRDILGESFTQLQPRDVSDLLALLDAQLAGGAGDGWQPISTAPSAKGRYLVACTEPRRPEWPPMIVIAYFRGGKDFFVGQVETAQNVTHWRPLPAPPTTTPTEPGAV